MLINKIGRNREIVFQYLEGDLPIKIDALIRDLGIEYFEDTLPEGISGQIERVRSGSEPNCFRITVNVKDSPNRKRFTAAHELGHFLLHRELIGEGLDDNAMYRSDLTKGHYKNIKVNKSHEIEANKMAAILLMPEKAVRAEASKPNATKESMAEIFEVSAEAMGYRLGKLGITL